MKAQDSDADLLLCSTVWVGCFVFIKNLEKTQANLESDNTKH